MIDIINKNIHETHRRKLSEIKQSRTRYIPQPEQSSPTIKNNPKGQYLKRVNMTKIQMDNLYLADKFREVLLRRTLYPTKSFQPHSMNKKTRQDFFSKVKTENKGIMQRIMNQKSFYSSTRLPPCPATLRKRTPRFKTQHSSNQLPKFPHEFQVLPSFADDFASRQIVLQQSTNILENLCLVEVSQSSKFDYVVLDFLSLGQKFKLRLSKETGQRLLDMCEKDGFFQRRITLERGHPVLTLQYHSFIRKYAFRRLYTGARRRAKSNLEGSLSFNSEILKRDLSPIRRGLGNEEQPSQFFGVRTFQRDGRDQKRPDQS